jgi:methylated-DNA-[protein]-cysteine S-methyltransferase
MPTSTFSTALGTCSLSWEGNLVTRFILPDDNLRPDENAPRPAWIEALIARVRNHFDGNLEDFSDVVLDWPRVSAFQKSVYLQTLAIRPGFTRSYGDISHELGLGNDGARSVGAALGANPWPLIVPCHRVVAANGKMTGFSAPGGIRTKTRMLALEGAELLSE